MKWYLRTKFAIVRVISFLMHSSKSLTFPSRPVSYCHFSQSTGQFEGITGITRMSASKQISFAAGNALFSLLKGRAEGDTLKFLCLS